MNLREKKIDFPKTELLTRPGIYQADNQDFETLSALQRQPHYDIYLEANNEKDLFVPLAGGAISRCRTVQINGVRFFIPVQQKTKVPKNVYEILKNMIPKGARDPSYQAWLAKPNQMKYLGEIHR